MNSNELAALLEQLGACPEFVEWAKGKDLQTAWDTFPRADWMLWLVSRMASKKGWPSRQTVVLAAGDCAEAALQFVAAGETRSKEDASAAFAVYADDASAYAASATTASVANYATHATIYYASRAGVSQERLADIVRKRIPVPFKEEA